MSEPKLVNEQAFPVSVFQEQYIQDHRRHPTSYEDNIPHIFYIWGQLNIDALRQSIREVQRRHSILRTIYPLSDGYRQIVLPPPSDGLTVVDLRAMGFAVRWQPHVAEVEKQPFDLTQEPSLRCTLFQVADREFVFSVVIHHIAFDYSSERIFFGELGAFYEHFLNQQEIQLPLVSFQYKDFAIGQRQHLESEAWLQKAEWWLQQLSAVPPLLTLPPDRPTPISSEFADRVLVQSPSSEFASTLKSFSKQHNISLFVLLYSALSALFHKLTGETDIIVGMPISTRNSVELERVIGLFSHDLILRTDLSGNPTFTQLLQQTANKVKLVLKHRDVSLYSLTKLAPGRSFRRRFLFKIHVNMLNAFYVPLSLADLDVQHIPLTSLDGPDLAVWFINRGQQGIQILWLYDSGQYSRAGVETWAVQYLALLERILDQPDLPLQKLLDT